MTMVKSSLSNYSDVYILDKEKITLAAFTAAARDRNNEHVLFKNFASFTNCTSNIYNTQVDNAKYFDVVIPMYFLTGYSDK